MRIFQHVPLRAQISKHSLPPSNVLVQRRISASKEILLPKRVIFPTHGLVPSTTTSSSTTTPANARPAACIPSMQAAPTTTAARRVCIGILRRSDVSSPLAQQLAPILCVQSLVALRLEGVHLLTVGGELGAEIPDALVRLVLFGRVQLLLREGVVLVDGLLEGRQRRAERAERGGGKDVVGARGGGVGGGGWVDGEVGKVFADGCALLESTVESCVLEMRRQLCSRTWLHAWRSMRVRK